MTCPLLLRTDEPESVRGFTLIEVMISIAIIAILASVGAPIYQGSLQAARGNKTVREMQEILRAIDIYRLQNGLEPPQTLADVGFGGVLDPWGNPYQYLNFTTGTGSAAANDKGSDKSNDKSNDKGNNNNNNNNNKNSGPVSIGQKRKDKNLVPLNSDFDFYSMGPDGKSVGPLTAKASRDDIVRANDGEFLGLACDY